MIVPGILATTAQELTHQLSLASRFTEVVHIDIADGTFVPNQTVDLATILQHASPIQSELHWMVKNLLPLVREAADHGFRSNIIHIETLTSPVDDLARLAALGILVTVALNPETDLAVLANLRPERVMLMAIQPGFQGKALLPTIFDRIRAVHKILPNAVIEIDGGVKDTNLPALYRAGARRFVVGSGLWQTPNPTVAFQKLCAREIELAREVSS